MVFLYLKGLPGIPTVWSILGSTVVPAGKEAFPLLPIVLNMSELLNVSNKGNPFASVLKAFTIFWLAI